eukprot:CAMPEP_0174825934 /NCGR_PEP_ID=MMETSP1107-20130205/43297_1 /TAXON_ID=36770 /ORGANISM="Paraphysomonas vestita, Strain GFlagA" /LENGTH=97 /DNA_ID=CAMNT_0016058125 /DNA_START=2107 /DNA_END=2400 /DNA_ORIENTATION=+
MSDLWELESNSQDEQMNALFNRFFHPSNFNNQLSEDDDSDYSSIEESKYPKDIENESKNEIQNEHEIISINSNNSDADGDDESQNSYSVNIRVVSHT